MTVPFLDLKAQYAPLQEEIDHAVKQVLNSAAFAGGPFVDRFEAEFAEFCTSGHCVGVGSGTEALWFALLALGVGPGDEVITVPNTFIATTEAVSFCGAFPVFVDVEEASFNMDPVRLRDFLETRCRRDASTGEVIDTVSGRPVKAIIPVHLYGHTADMDPILDVARAYGIPVVEDASQAHGAQYKGRLAGSMGDVGCFSFYPGKNLGAYGEAGAVVTDNGPLADRMRILRDHGQSKKYHHSAIGWNGRMDGIQGAVLSVKLKYLNGWNENRRRAAARYDTALAGIDGVIPPLEAESAKHVYHVYAVRVQNREALMEALMDKQIHSAVHYPVPIHLQAAYAFLGLESGQFPVAEKCARQEVSLPMYAELSGEQISRVADAVKGFFAE